MARPKAGVRRSNKPVKKARKRSGKAKMSIVVKTPPKVASKAAVSSATETITFKMEFVASLTKTDWDGGLSQQTDTNTRHFQGAFFQQLSLFAGFTNTCARYDMVKPISITLKARLCKNAFGVSFQDRYNNSLVLNDPNGVNQSGHFGGGVDSGTAFKYAKVYSVIDYDGKDGKGGDLKYEKLDFMNSANTAESYISGGVPKKLAQWVPKQYTSTVGNNSGVAKIMMDKSQWYGTGNFVETNGSSKVSQPKFGGMDFSVVSYDAAGNGYNGKVGNTDPVIGLMYEYVLKAAFKAPTRYRNVE